MPEGKFHFTFSLNAHVKALFHEECIRNNTTMSDIVESQMADYIVQSRKKREVQKKILENNV